MGWYVDFTKRAWHAGVLLSITALISGAVMLAPPSRGAKFFALYFNGCQYAGQTAMFAWANAVIRDDDAKRGVIIGAMNMVAIAVYMFWSLVFYSTEQGPDWTEGSIAMICMGGAFFVNTMVIWYLARRDRWKTVSESLAMERPASSAAATDCLDEKEQTKVGSASD